MPNEHAGDAHVNVQALEEFLDLLLPHSFLDLDYRIHEARTGSRPELTVEFSGSDLALIVENRGELLLALEHLAAKALRLEPEEHDRICFEAGTFKAERDRHLSDAAEQARRYVAETGKEYHFQAMSSRERRMLHLALSSFGLYTKSEGEGARRHLVVFPGAGAAAD